MSDEDRYVASSVSGVSGGTQYPMDAFGSSNSGVNSSTSIRTAPSEVRTSLQTKPIDRLKTTWTGLLAAAGPAVTRTAVNAIKQAMTSEIRRIMCIPLFLGLLVGARADTTV